ncbi:hypothetical protein ABZY16_01125 [Streptomyces sp. NPDC006553]|nr:hypothetical protein [Streptomyces sp. NBC_00233]MCX5232442.1 hypothetical protein [Streptomyces sp. NBC_00233]
MGRTSSTRQCLWQAASGVRPAVVAPVTAADVEAPPTRRIALHGHG